MTPASKPTVTVDVMPRPITANDVALSSGEVQSIKEASGKTTAPSDVIQCIHVNATGLADYAKLPVDTDVQLDVTPVPVDANVAIHVTTGKPPTPCEDVSCVTSGKQQDPCEELLDVTLDKATAQNEDVTDVTLGKTSAPSEDVTDVTFCKTSAPSEDVTDVIFCKTPAPSEDVKDVTFVKSPGKTTTPRKDFKTTPSKPSTPREDVKIETPGKPPTSTKDGIIALPGKPPTNINVRGFAHDNDSTAFALGNLPASVTGVTSDQPDKTDSGVFTLEVTSSSEAFEELQESSFDGTAELAASSDVTSESTLFCDGKAKPAPSSDVTAESASTFDVTAESASSPVVTAQSASSYDVTAESASSYDVTAESASSYDVTAQWASSYDVTAESASSYDVTAESVSSFDVTAASASSSDVTAELALPSLGKNSQVQCSDDVIVTGQLTSLAYTAAGVEETPGVPAACNAWYDVVPSGARRDVNFQVSDVTSVNQRHDDSLPTNYAVIHGRDTPDPSQIEAGMQALWRPLLCSELPLYTELPASKRHASYYPMQRRPLGIAVVIVNEFFQRNSHRYGADKDIGECATLYNILTWIEFLC